MKVITDSRALPKSFATLDFYGDNAFVFVDSAGTKRPGRYQIIPVAGVAHLDSAAAAKVSPDYLFDDLPRRVARGPITYKVFAQLANPGDQTNDGSIIWPSDRSRSIRFFSRTAFRSPMIHSCRCVRRCARGPCNIAISLTSWGGLLACPIPRGL